MKKFVGILISAVMLVALMGCREAEIRADIVESAPPELLRNMKNIMRAGTLTRTRVNIMSSLKSNVERRRFNGRLCGILFRNAPIGCFMG